MKKCNTTVIAERIRRLRKKSGLSQKDFAEKIGITPATLSSYENSATVPSASVLSLSAEKLHISVDWLLGLSDDTNFNITTSYTDVIRVFDKIAAEREVVFDVCENNDTYDFCLRFNKKDFPNIDFSEFLNKREQMQKMYKEGLVDRDFYKIWLEVTIEKMEE